MLNQKQLDYAIGYRIQPYAQEAMIQVVIDVLIVLMLIVISVLAKFPLSICIPAVVLYITLAVTLGYRVLILAQIDRHKKDVVTEIVTIQQFKDEYTFFAADSFGYSYIRIFYPKDMHVKKYMVKVVNKNGEKKKLRSVMSFNRLLSFVCFNQHQIERLEVMYLRRSKILLFVNPVDEIDKKLPKKTRKGIEKAIHYINRSI